MYFIFIYKQLNDWEKTLNQLIWISNIVIYCL